MGSDSPRAAHTLRALLLLRSSFLQAQEIALSFAGEARLRIQAAATPPAVSFQAVQDSVVRRAPCRRFCSQVVPDCSGFPFRDLVLAALDFPSSASAPSSPSSCVRVAGRRELIEFAYALARCLPWHSQVVLAVLCRTPEAVYAPAVQALSCSQRS